MANRSRVTLALSEFLYSSESDDDLELRAQIQRFRNKNEPRIKCFLNVVKGYTDYKVRNMQDIYAIKYKYDVNNYICLLIFY